MIMVMIFYNDFIQLNIFMKGEDIIFLYYFKAAKKVRLMPEKVKSETKMKKKNITPSH